MSRYIDADDLLKSEIKRCGCIPTIGSCYKDEKRFDFVLQEQPTADVVEVVRCKDCISYEADVEYYGGGTKNICRLFKRQMREDCYCSYGKKVE